MSVSLLFSTRLVYCLPRPCAPASSDNVGITSLPRHQDEENDIISIRTQSDLDEAILLAFAGSEKTTPTIKLFIRTVAGGATDTNTIADPLSDEHGEEKKYFNAMAYDFKL
jgi:hypothetical protein